jgi:hypothetical protein
MPSIDDEDETLCLLAADQEESPGPRQPAPCGGGAASYNQVSIFCGKANSFQVYLLQIVHLLDL